MPDSTNAQKYKCPAIVLANDHKEEQIHLPMQYICLWSIRRTYEKVLKRYIYFIPSLIPILLLDVYLSNISSGKPVFRQFKLSPIHHWN